MQLWATLVDLAIGRCCLDCGLVGASWCDPCLRAALEVHSCTTPGGRVVVAAARYGGSVRSAVVNHKEQGHLALATPLGRLLAAATVPERAGTDAWGPMLVPIPSTRASSRARGHDHARRLARAAADLTGIPVQAPLYWSRQVQDQAGLSALNRRANVHGAMHARAPAASGAKAWLVDDVMTTGATLDEGARSLEAAGWRVAGASVVAAVDDRRALARRDALR